MADLDNLIKTVKAKQNQLNEKRIEMSDLGTQVTPSLSRVDTTPPKLKGRFLYSSLELFE